MSVLEQFAERMERISADSDARILRAIEDEGRALNRGSFKRAGFLNDQGVPRDARSLELFELVALRSALRFQKRLVLESLDGELSNVERALRGYER